MASPPVGQFRTGETTQIASHEGNQRVSVRNKFK